MVTVNLRYKGANARAFAEKMIASGTVDLIRAEPGNLRYEYYMAIGLWRQNTPLTVVGAVFLAVHFIHVWGNLR